MIIDLPQTTTSVVAKRLVKLRDEGGAIALGRILTLVVVAAPDDVEVAVQAANDASQEHPCRIVVLTPQNSEADARLDAQIRVGGDAGASEVIILAAHGRLADHIDTLVIPLLLPDTPVVAWWPRGLPTTAGEQGIEALARVRITDSVRSADPIATLAQLRDTYEPTHTDLAWTRVTLWRGLLAATLDQPPFEPVHSVTVEGDVSHPSVDLIAAWLARTLRCPVEMVRVDDAQAITKVMLHRMSGDIAISRPSGSVATLAQPEQPTHKISLPVRSLKECLSEELRRLDPDEIFGEVLTKGLSRVPGWEHPVEKAQG